MSDSKVLTLDSAGAILEVLLDTLADKTPITLASSATVDLYNVTSNFIQISGNTAITSFGTPAASGARRIVQFTGALTLTHGTGAGTIRLPGLANITTAIGDYAEFISSGSAWHCTSYTKLDGTPIVSSGGVGLVLTPTNFCDYALKPSWEGGLVNKLYPKWLSPGVGIAIAPMLARDGIFTSPPQQLQKAHGSLVSGIGAAISYTGDVQNMLTGAAASTGCVYLYNYTEPYTSNPVPPADLNNLYAAIDTANREFACRVSHICNGSAVTDVMNICLGFFGYNGTGIDITSDPIAGQPGIFVTYQRNVNSNNYQIKYSNQAGALITLNTTQPLSNNAASPVTILVRVKAGLTTVQFNNNTPIQITDYILNAVARHTGLMFQHRIRKVSGAANVGQSQIMGLVLAQNLHAA